MTQKGYLSEIFSSIQGEGGSVWGSCFGKRQIFLRFSGCNLVEKDFGSNGCLWCDSFQSQNPKPREFWHEKSPGSEQKVFSMNPIEVPNLIKIIQSLSTNDLHSISFTGGEPLLQLEFLLQLANRLTQNEQINFPLYLETNGSISPTNLQYDKIGKLFTYCCCDIKDRSSRAAESSQWKNLVTQELAFISNLTRRKVITFAKIVVTSKTQLEDIRWIAGKLTEIRTPDGGPIGLAIQPVYLENSKLKKEFAISKTHLNQIFNAASKFMKPYNLSLSIQAHKYLNIL